MPGSAYKLGLFEPATQDRSLIYLAKLFGPVGNALSASGAGGGAGNLFSSLFQQFNRGLLVIALFVLVYTTVMVTINTIQEGSIMGQRHNTVLTVLRIVLGFGLLVPRFNGYSFIQVIVMWVVVHGVGFADHAWTYIINYVTKQGGQLYASTTSAATQIGNIETMAKGLSSIMDSQICLASLQRIADNTKIAPKTNGLTFGTTVKDQEEEGDYNYCTKYDNHKFMFGIDRKLKEIFPSASNGKMNLKEICGSTSWAFGKADTGGSGFAGNRSTACNYRRTAIRQVILNTKPAADYIANQPIDVLKQMSDLKGTSIDDMSGELRYSVSQYVNALTNSVQNFVQLIRPALGLVNQGKNQRVLEQLQEQQKQGWIMAGAMYKKLAAMQRAEKQKLYTIWQVKANGPKLGAKLSTNSTNDNFEKLNGDVRDILKNIKHGYQGFKNAAIQEVRDRVKEATEAGKQGEKNVKGVSLDLLKSATNGPPTPVEERGSSGDFESMGGGVIVAITTATPALIAVGAAMVGSIFAGNIVGGIGSIVFPPAALSVIFLVIPWIIHAVVADIMNTMQSATDPILAAQSLGLNLLGVTYWIWAGVTLFSMLIALAAFLFDSVLPFGGMMEIFTMWLTPIVSVLLTSMAVPGMLLGIYVPLMPFIIYFFAGVGWIIAVLEAMIAAPLVALGVTHPEGHDFLGQSEQAMYLLLNVFLRPILMVIGLVAGMVISRIAFTFLNEGFYQILADTGLLNPINSLFTGGLQMLGILFVYTSTLISMLNLSYSTIHQIPDRIMRWLGRSEETSQASQYAQSVQSSTTSAAGQVGGAMKTQGPLQSAQTGAQSNQGNQLDDQGGGDAGGSAQGSQSGKTGGAS